MTTEKIDHPAFAHLTRRTESIEHMPLRECYGTGSWTNAQAEGFSEEGSEVITHLHIYNVDRLLYALDHNKWSIPSTIKTYSF